MTPITVKQAKERVCPFLSNSIIDGSDIVFCKKTCMADDCMAWMTTKTHEQVEAKFEPTDNKSMAASRYMDGNELADEDKEGICMRIVRR